MRGICYKPCTIPAPTCGAFVTNLALSWPHIRGICYKPCTIPAPTCGAFVLTDVYLPPCLQQRASDRNAQLQINVRLSFPLFFGSIPCQPRFQVYDFAVPFFSFPECFARSIPVICIVNMIIKLSCFQHKEAVHMM